MLTDYQQHMIYICSDSTGETAEAVARATMRQFAFEHMKLKRFGHMKHEEEIRSMMLEAAETGGVVAYTLVQPELREFMREEAVRSGVRAVDLLGPMMQAVVDTFHDSPKRQVGLMQEMDAAYFKRIEAIEFAVKFDDGKDARGLLQAEVVLIGVSRTSKTPLSVFLAHKGIKTANLPLMPEVKPPAELIAAPGRLIVGLTMTEEHLLKIRTERLRALGLPNTAKYATVQRIQEELNYAHGLMKELGCPIIDVTDKAIEETAGIIMSYLA